MALFDGLCETAPAEQVVAIATLERRDPDLAEQLRQLLGADRAPHAGLESGPALVDDAPAVPARYQVLGRLGAGGMGEVWQVHDRHLHRALAMKILHVARPDLAVRFQEEAQVLAQLQHPNIVPIHEMGSLDDGRLWFTMRLVRGETWHARLKGCTPGPIWLRDQVQVLLRVAQAVAFAHDQGVVHRDLKPNNIMLGAFGEVMVLDWGIARLMRNSAVISTQQGARAATGSGVVMGTPMYMGPEQALGQVDAIGPPTDVYALGAMLYTLLAGQPPLPITSTPATVLQVRPAPLPDTTPAPLRQLCGAAMAIEPSARPANAGIFARTLSRWLSGAADRVRARKLLERTAEQAAQIATLSAQIEAAQQSADALLATVPPYAPASEKAPGWAEADRALAARDRRTILHAERLHLLRTALNLTPDLLEARQQLAQHHRVEAQAAEARRDGATAAAHLHALATYDDGTHAAWLAGQATLHVQSDPPGQRVQIGGWRTVGRRQIPARVTTRGVTPMTASLAAGAWRISVGQVVVPVALGRAETQTITVPMPPPDLLGSDRCYVPAGDFEAGGDANAPDCVPRTRVHVPGFIMRRDPITNAEFIAFLDALVQAGQGDEADRWAPREPASGSHQPVYQRTAQGGFAVGTDAEGVVWTLDAPVVQITWHAAMAWCAWAAQRDGVPWRLPHELEWEKAARGPDGRFYPWGDGFDPSFVRMLQSVEGKPRRCPVDAHPADVSPYGVRGMGGNVRDLCLNAWERGAPPRRLQITLPATDDQRLRSTRGGSFYSQPHFCRAATRFAGPVDQGFASVGFRPCFTWPQSPD